MCGIGFKGQIPEFVDDQELSLGKLRESLLEPTFAATFGKLRYDSRGCDELNGMPSQDRFAPKSDRKVLLANARCPSGTFSPFAIQRALASSHICLGPSEGWAEKSNPDRSRTNGKRASLSVIYEAAENRSDE
jgi:hypothetical protein